MNEDEDVEVLENLIRHEKEEDLNDEKLDSFIVMKMTTLILNVMVEAEPCDTYFLHIDFF